MTHNPCSRCDDGRRLSPGATCWRCDREGGEPDLRSVLVSLLAVHDAFVGYVGTLRMDDFGSRAKELALLQAWNEALEAARKAVR